MKRNFVKTLEQARHHNEAPFPREEYAARLKRIRQLMADDNVDLLFLTSPESLFYVSGFQCEWY